MIFRANLWAILIIGFLSSGFEVQRHSKRLILKTSSCYETLELLSPLKSWTENLGELPRCQTAPDCRSTDITSCVPHQLAKYHGLSPGSGGPNCFNLALVMSQVLPSLRNSSMDEMGFYISSPLCRPLKLQEKRNPGDIGLVYLSSKSPLEEYHAFIYLSDKMVYSKNGDGILKESTYALQSLEEVLKIYDVPSKAECRQNQLKIPSDCGQAVAYFRCHGMQSYLRDTESLPRVLKISFERMQKFEAALELHLFQKKPLGPAAQKSLLEIAGALNQYLLDQKDKLASLTTPQQFVLGSLQMKLLSIADQLELAVIGKADTEPTSRALLVWARQIQESAQALSPSVRLRGPDSANPND